MAEEHQRRGQENEKRLRESEMAMQRKIEEEQEETLAVSKARDSAMADVKKHQVPPRSLHPPAYTCARIHMRPHTHAPAYTCARIHMRPSPKTAKMNYNKLNSTNLN